MTFLLIRTIGHYNRLAGATGKTGLGDILDVLLKNQETVKQHISEIEKGVRFVDDAGKFHIQRIGLVRFNPFSDTGGSQSFTLAILDSKENGIIMTSLYARTGNRWYVKEIRNGKGKDFELSKEEMTAIKKASPIDKENL